MKRPDFTIAPKDKTLLDDPEVQKYFEKVMKVVAEEIERNNTAFFRRYLGKT